MSLARGAAPAVWVGRLSRLGDELGLHLGLGFGLGSEGSAAACFGVAVGCGLGRRRGFGGRLIALDQFRRNALRHPGRALREYGVALARQRLLGVEDVGIENRRGIEILTACERERLAPARRRSNQCAQSPSLRAPQLLPVPVKATSISTRVRVAAGVCASVMIMSIQRFACVMSPARQAASTRNSRARMAENAIAAGERLEPCPRLVKSAGIDEEAARAQRGKILQAPARRAPSAAIFS